MKSNATRKDMDLANKLFRYTSPAELPLAFTYEGRRIHGIPAEFAPAMERRMVDGNIVQVIVRGENEKGLHIRVEYDEYRDYPVTEYLAFFENHGAEDTGLIEDVRIAEGVIPCGEATFIYGNGDTLRDDGYEWFRSDLEEKKTLMPVDGTSCNGAFPYMRLQGGEYGVNIAIGWPAMWKAEVAKAEGGVYISVGQKRCSMILHPGEVMRTPRITLMGYMGDETRGTNMWRRWHLTHILPRENGQPVPPKCCMHVFEAGGKPEFTGATEENQVGGIEDYVSRGVKPDIWWVDAGWYPCNFEWYHTGTWRPNPEHFPNGLTPLGEKCEQEGIQLLLWFEPERAVKDSELDREHPEWMLKWMREKDGEIVPDDNRLLNLGDKACCDWLIEHVDALIKKSKVHLYRQDFNFNPEPHWIQNEGEGRIGALENFHVQGYLRYWDALIERNPGLWIDSCASGGRRNDLETMRRAVTLHYTDVGYGNHPIKQKQHWQMFAWIPYFRAHNMNWDDPVTGEYTNTSRESDAYSYYCAMTPALTDMLKHDAPEEAYALARKMQPIWRKAAGYMLSGDYYPLTECRKSREDFYAVQFHDEEKNEGFVEIIRNNACMQDEYLLKMQGLDTEGSYLLTEAESGEAEEYSAEALCRGVSVALPIRTGRIYFYQKKQER